MKCPVCGEQARRTDKRDTIYKITHRSYECKSCFTPFKTQEKIVFESIPKYLREKYLDEGKFK